MRKAVRLSFGTMLLFAVLFLSGIAYGCTPAVADFTVGKFRSTYEVDDVFDPSNAKLEVKYKDETSLFVDLTAAMVSGFSTATSGTRELTISYQGVTKRARYTVLGDIHTATRLQLNHGAGAECVVELVAPDLAIWAISFLLQGDIAEIRGEFSVGLSGWKVQTVQRENGISVLLFTEFREPIKEKSVILNFLCERDSTFYITQILVADTATEYAVPNAELAKNIA